GGALIAVAGARRFARRIHMLADSGTVALIERAGVAVGGACDTGRVQLTNRRATIARRSVAVLTRLRRVDGPIAALGAAHRSAHSQASGGSGEHFAVASSSHGGRSWCRA